MNDSGINHDVVKKIVRFSYKRFKAKQSTNMTKSQIIDEIVKMLKKEINDNANSKD